MRFNSLKCHFELFLNPFSENCQINLFLSTNISATAQVLKLKFLGLSNFCFRNRYAKFQQNLRGLPRDPFLSCHGSTLYFSVKKTIFYDKSIFLYNWRCISNRLRLLIIKSSHILIIKF